MEQTVYYRRAEETAERYTNAEYEKFLADLEKLLEPLREGAAQFVEYSNRKAEETTALGCGFFWYLCIFFSLCWVENKSLSGWFDSFHLTGGEGVAAMLTLLAVNIALSHLLFQVIDRGWQKSPPAVLGTAASIIAIGAVIINSSVGVTKKDPVSGVLVPPEAQTSSPLAKTSAAEVLANQKAEHLATQKALIEKRTREAEKKEAR